MAKSGNVVRLGDPTNHGGTVITASSTSIMDGKKVALVGDMVTCPIKGHGPNKIIEGSDHWISDGKAVVVDGCACECGCKVISTLGCVSVG